MPIISKRQIHDLTSIQNVRRLDLQSEAEWLPGGWGRGGGDALEVQSLTPGEGTEVRHLIHSTLTAAAVKGCMA